MKNISKPIILVGIILIAAATRIIPHPHNFAPIAALALFGSYNFKNFFKGLLIPFLAIFGSDLFINNVTYAQYQEGFVWVSKGSIFIYIAFLAIALLGKLTLKNTKIESLIKTSLVSSIVFFVLSNVGVWLASGMYSPTLGGLAECFFMAIPFFGNTVIGDLFYITALFGVYDWYSKKVALETK